MNFNRDGAPDEQTRVDHQPSGFPAIGPIGAAYDPPPPSVGQLFGGPIDVGQAAPSNGRPGRKRWLIAALATLAVVALVGGALVLAGPGAGTPSTSARYAPLDTVSYLELRLDLPGDQRAKLAEFMAHFPGFADPASFDQKIHDTLNQMLITSQADINWYDDIEPWFGGEMAVFSSNVSQSPGTPPSTTFVLTVSDKSALDTLMSQKVLGADATELDYQGQTIWTLTGGPDGQRVFVATTGDALLIGLRLEDVESALDARTSRRPGLAQDPFFLQQLGALHGDRLATIYVDSRAAAGSLRDQLPTGLPSADSFDWLIDAAAVRMVGEVRAEANHLVLSSRADRPAAADLPPLPANKVTDLAEYMPADTQVYFEGRQVGSAIGFVVGKLLEPLTGGPEGGFDPRLIEQFLGTKPEVYLDFVDDVAIGVAYRDDDLEIGLVATVDDEAVARQRVDRLLTTLRTLILFGDGVTFEEVTHGDAQVTVIGLGALISDAPVASISVSVARGRLLVGSGDFVVNALDRQATDSLAAQAAFKTALADAGPANAGLVFMDVAALRALSESMMLPNDRVSYETDRQPFIAPLKSLAIVSVTDGAITVSHVLLYVE